MFDVRITHKGDSSSSFYYKIKRKIGFNLINYERLSCFFTFGLNNQFTAKFSEKNMDRQLSQLGSKSSLGMPEELKQKLTELGVYTYY